MGGGIEGQKKKAKNEQEKKGGKKVCGKQRFWQPTGGNQAANFVQPSGSFHQCFSVPKRRPYRFAHDSPASD